MKTYPNPLNALTPAELERIFDLVTFGGAYFGSKYHAEYFGPNVDSRLIELELAALHGQIIAPTQYAIELVTHGRVF